MTILTPPPPKMFQYFQLGNSALDMILSYLHPYTILKTHVSNCHASVTLSSLSSFQWSVSTSFIISIPISCEASSFQFCMNFLHVVMFSVISALATNIHKVRISVHSVITARSLLEVSQQQRYCRRRVLVTLNCSDDTKIWNKNKLCRVHNLILFL